MMRLIIVVIAVASIGLVAGNEFEQRMFQLVDEVLNKDNVPELRTSFKSLASTKDVDLEIVAKNQKGNKLRNALLQLNPFNVFRFSDTSFGKHMDVPFGIASLEVGLDIPVNPQHGTTISTNDFARRFIAFVQKPENSKLVNHLIKVVETGDKESSIVLGRELVVRVTGHHF